MNTSSTKKTINFSRFSERINGFRTAQNVLTGTSLQLSENSDIQGTEMLVLELKK
jgi:hypothetical protein